jgi:hypothetical protein
LHPDLGGFCPVVWRGCLLEPRMLERLFGGDAFRRVIYEDLLQKIEEVSAKFVVVGDDFLEDVII